MVSVKFSVLFLAVFVFLAQFHSGYSLFLGYKKELLKHKLYKLKEALLHDHDDYGEVHHIHYKSEPVYISSGYSKWPSYSVSKWPSYYGSAWPSYYKGWSHY